MKLANFTKNISFIDDKLVSRISRSSETQWGSVAPYLWGGNPPEVFLWAASTELTLIDQRCCENQIKIDCTLLFHIRKFCPGICLRTLSKIYVPHFQDFCLGLAEEPL